MLSPEGHPTWHAVFIDPSGVRALDPAPPPSLVAEGAGVDPGTRALLDLLQAASTSYIEFLELVAHKLDQVQAQLEPAKLADLTALHRAITRVHPKVARLSVLVTELGGSLGTHFPGLADRLPAIRADAAHLEEFVNGLSQGLRDLVALRNAAESNRLANAANEIGKVSNQIAALANTSNLRMLGVAYLALFIALMSVIVLFPNTGATILGMPSAAWVPGVWVDVILVVLTVVPLILVLTRPWVRQILAGLPTFEVRSAEGLTDIPELRPQDVAPSSPGEGFIRESR